MNTNQKELQEKNKQESGYEYELYLEVQKAFQLVKIQEDFKREKMI